MAVPLPNIPYIRRTLGIEPAQGLAAYRTVDCPGFDLDLGWGGCPFSLIRRDIKIRPETGDIKADCFSVHIAPEDMNDRAIRCIAVLNLVDGNFYAGNLVWRAGGTHTGTRMERLRCHIRTPPVHRDL